MWPTLWGIMAAANGLPDWHLVIHFWYWRVLPMRSAGCVINDYADRKVDGMLDRTKKSSYSLCRVSEKRSGLFFLSYSPFWVLFLVLLPIYKPFYSRLSARACCSVTPFMKTNTHLHSFSWIGFFVGHPYAYSAQGGDFSRSRELWMLFA